MIDRNDYIFKNKRRYFKATCDQCGTDRGYKTPNHAERLCNRCNNIKANKASIAAKASRPKKEKLCSIEGCLNKSCKKNLCNKHYRQQKHKNTVKVKKIKQCEYCHKDFECKSLKAQYCSSKCRDIVYRELHPNRVAVLKINHPDKWAKQNEKRNIMCQLKYKNSIDFRLAATIRSRISRALKRGLKGGSAIRDLGCTIKDLKLYLQSKFQPGMTLENYGQWHIDHIKPLSSFDMSDPIQFKQACHYTNLQPLWALDNMKKGDKYEADI